jgi:hypothetical protein
MFATLLFRKEFYNTIRRACLSAPSATLYTKRRIRRYRNHESPALRNKQIRRHSREEYLYQHQLYYEKLARFPYLLLSLTTTTTTAATVIQWTRRAASHHFPHYDSVDSSTYSPVIFDISTALRSHSLGFSNRCKNTELISLLTRLSTATPFEIEDPSCTR